MAIAAQVAQGKEGGWEVFTLSLMESIDNIPLIPCPKKTRIRTLAHAHVHTRTLTHARAHPPNTRRLLSQCQLWHSCAHGRPTAAPLAHLPSLVGALAGRQATQQQRQQPGKQAQQPSASAAALRAPSSRGPAPTIESVRKSMRRPPPASGP